MSTVQRLRDGGFDQSYAIPFQHAWHIGCSECQALAVNGVATHESGCPNRRDPDARCDHCGDVLPRHPYTHSSLDDEKFCTAYCAEQRYEQEAT
jgi:hypothetical protein